MSIFWMTSHIFCVYFSHVFGNFILETIVFHFWKSCDRRPHTFHTHAATTTATTREKISIRVSNSIHVQHLPERERERFYLVRNYYFGQMRYWNFMKQAREMNRQKKKIQRKLSRLIFTNSGRVFLSHTRSLSLCTTSICQINPFIYRYIFDILFFCYMFKTVITAYRNMPTLNVCMFLQINHSKNEVTCEKQ